MIGRDWQNEYTENKKVVCAFPTDVMENPLKGDQNEI